MKNKHILRLAIAVTAAVAGAWTLSSCEGLWMSAESGFDFTQPGGFGLDLGVGGPIGNPTPPPPPYGGFGGPGLPPPGGPGWGPW